MRIAIISTPRCGNTWLMHMLDTLYQAFPVWAHNPTEVSWGSLPASCVLQMHWHPERAFVDRLEQEGFRVVVLSRHPLDVLISILHFALHDPTARWLEAEEGDERPIHGAMPRSTAFRDYALGRRARALLAVSHEWWSLPTSLRLRYEDLVAEPVAELKKLVENLGGVTACSLEHAIAANTIPQLRRQWQNPHHYWQGKADLWKRLLTVEEATPIHAAHSALFQCFSYQCEPDSGLGGAEADANWINLVWSELAESLHSLRETRRRLAELEVEPGKLRADLELARGELARLHEAHDVLRWQHHEVLADVSPRVLSVARQFSRLSRRHPQAAAFVKKFMRIAG